MKEKRSLNKINDKEYELLIDNEESKYYQRKIYTKEELKDNYKMIKAQLSNIEFNLKNNKKTLKELDVEFTEEEKKLKEIVEKVLMDHQRDKVLKDIEKLEADEKMMKDQAKEIELAVPEVLRN